MRMLGKHCISTPITVTQLTNMELSNEALRQAGNLSLPARITRRVWAVTRGLRMRALTGKHWRRGKRPRDQCRAARCRHHGRNTDAHRRRDYDETEKGMPHAFWETRMPWIASSCILRCAWVRPGAWRYAWRGRLDIWQIAPQCLKFE